MNIGFIGLGKMGRAVAGRLIGADDARNVPMPFASILRDNFMELIATGGAENDWAALAQLAAHRAGLDRRG